ncbi:MAG TPA: glycosyltransferase [Saprospiraceae bacterium]|nr:glycosyltransferase [Saprospiraceae bacterium]
MKTLLYLSYHYEPDWSAGAFRNTALVRTLMERYGDRLRIHVLCTQPNRYAGGPKSLPEKEVAGNLTVYRIPVPQHGNRFIKQIISFLHYRRGVKRIVSDQEYDFTFASTSKLFTGHLAFEIFKARKIPYDLDLRDLFADNLRELIRIPLLNRLFSGIVRHFFERPVLRNARHIHINSMGFRSNIPEDYPGEVHFHPNGIDEAFLNWRQDEHLSAAPKQICYAGNFGAAQGLHKIIPKVAKTLENTHRFVLIGDGSARDKLMRALERMEVKNVQWLPPVARKELIAHYERSHYLLIHLNNYQSFEKVLPSKLMEYAAGNLPILAGVAGQARKFLEEEVKVNVFTFDPCDADALIGHLIQAPYRLQDRPEFVKSYDRGTISHRMAEVVWNEINRRHEGA